MFNYLVKVSAFVCMIQFNTADAEIITDKGCPQRLQSVFNLYCGENAPGNYPVPGKRSIGQSAFITCLTNIAYCQQCPSGLVFVKSGPYDYDGTCEYTYADIIANAVITDGEFCPDTFKAVAQSQCTRKADGNYVFPFSNNRYPNLYITCSEGIGFCQRCPSGLKLTFSGPNDRIGICDYINPASN